MRETLKQCHTFSIQCIQLRRKHMQDLIQFIQEGNPLSWPCC